MKKSGVFEIGDKVTVMSEDGGPLGWEDQVERIEDIDMVKLFYVDRLFNPLELKHGWADED
jgi:hypothetical protein